MRSNSVVWHHAASNGLDCLPVVKHKHRKLRFDNVSINMPCFYRGSCGVPMLFNVSSYNYKVVNILQQVIRLLFTDDWILTTSVWEAALSRTFHTWMVLRHNSLGFWKFCVMMNGILFWHGSSSKQFCITRVDTFAIITYAAATLIRQQISFLSKARVAL